MLRVSPTCRDCYLLLAFLIVTAIVGVSIAQPLDPNYQGLNETAAARDLDKQQQFNHEVHCSRERSRAAREIIEKYLTPFVERERYEIPRTCKLHPESDLFGDQEKHKVQLDVNEWQCGYCKKSFLSEEFLDKHFDSRHYNLLDFSQSKCLADLCGALHCDHVVRSKSPKTKCNPAAAARNRHLCESLADACFPVIQGPSASRLHELFLQQFCEAHKCSGERKPFSRGAKKEANVIYMAASILTLMLLPLFYVLVYLHNSEMRKGTHVLRRISKQGRKAKPS